MKIIKTKSNNSFLLSAIFTENNTTIQGQTTEDASLLNTTINLGRKCDLTIEKFSDIIEKFIHDAERNYDIDIDTFVTEKITNIDAIKILLEKFIINETILSYKTINKKVHYEHNIISQEFTISDFSETILLATQMASVKYYQDMPPNICTIDFLTKELEKIFKDSKLIKTKILNKDELKELGMNLILSVNAGSHQSAKVIVCEYINNPTSNDKIAIVGKGIIFDSGGYDLKTGKWMTGMKYDMSGAVIAAHILNVIDRLGLTSNVSIVLPLTDNLVDSNATLPESIVKSMNGRTVEIVNTDAEGRLILADGITYASKYLKANLIIDISTLTGSILSALGHLYTGVWSSSEANWDLLEMAAKKANEKVWRMPLNEKYIESLSNETFADIKSCSNTEYSDCNIAASWLYSFVEKSKEYMHFDIAGTADIKGHGKSPMLKTIVEFIKNKN
ncbi:MAG: M17 family metallopeptidase [Metamycoplasmataceae bacterium]